MKIYFYEIGSTNKQTPFIYLSEKKINRVRGFTIMFNLFYYKPIYGFSGKILTTFYQIEGFDNDPKKLGIKWDLLQSQKILGSSNPHQRKNLQELATQFDSFIDLITSHKTNNQNIHILDFYPLPFFIKVYQFCLNRNEEKSKRKRSRSHSL